ncbi:MAG: copper resistance protein CopC, partial [Actinomycetota bacterium]
MRRRLGTLRWLAATGAAAALVLVPAAAAEAHAAFVSSTPSPGAELRSAPGVVVLRFSEPLVGRLSNVVVADPTGATWQG